MSTVQKLYTVRDVAELLSLSSSRVRQLCILHDIGEIHGTTRILSDEDLERLKSIPRVMGRPRQAS